MNHTKPKRTTKNAGKLVLLDFPEKKRQESRQSLAEKTPKPHRRDLPALPRLTAYSLSSSINLDIVSAFLKHSHGVNAEVYACDYDGK